MRMSFKKSGLGYFGSPTTWYPHYDGDAAVADPPVVDPAAAGDPPATGGDDKKFTQKDVDKLIGQRFKKERTENEKLLNQLQAIKQNGLTPESKEELETQITRLQESFQTKEQTLQQKMAETEKKLNKQIEGTASERDTWKNRFHKSTVERSILDAGIATDAEDATQMVLMFGPLARLEEEVDSAGKGTGSFVTKMKVNGLDPETKKPTVLDLTPAEAFNHFREHGLHKNLFKHKAASGTGKEGGGSGGNSNATGNSPPERSKFASEEEYSGAYQTWRETHNADGSPIQKK